ncbi:protein SHQ1 homolog isoform X2 [Dysidea avara]|uniref:protein SHQ1 homolog isoform X2 n=1 Tax=Dysidea avara TaxID=196820 RepID=UPI00331D573F
MLTPSFDTEQNDEFVIITIRCPYIKISDVDFHISGNEFKFHCNPYFLRLNLPGEVVENCHAKASYDVNTGSIVVHLPKKSSGEFFEGLGLLTKLLSSKGATCSSSVDTKKTSSTDVSKLNYKPLIEVLDASSSGDSKGACVCVDDEDDEFDWSIEQTLPEEDTTVSSLLNNKVHYGFANQYSGVLSKLQQEMPSIVDVPSDQLEVHERRIARITHEESSFSEDHYIADYMENEQIKMTLKYKPEWVTQLKQWKEQNDLIHNHTEPDNTAIPFTNEENFQLKNLPNREFLLDKATLHSVYLGLVDIIYSFAYNCRINEGESNVEAAWTICKLSATLSWLEVYSGSVKEVVYCCIRRSLCYPLYRHWELSQLVLEDTRQIFHLDENCYNACYQFTRSSQRQNLTIF